MLDIYKIYLSLFVGNCSAQKRRKATNLYDSELKCPKATNISIRYQSIKKQRKSSHKVLYIHIKFNFSYQNSNCPANM